MIYLGIFFHLNTFGKKFQSKIITLNKNDPTYESRKKCYENAMEEELDAVKLFEKNQRRGGRKREFQEITEK